MRVLVRPLSKLNVVYFFKALSWRWNIVFRPSHVHPGFWEPGHGTQELRVPCGAPKPWNESLSRFVQHSKDEIDF